MARSRFAQAFFQVTDMALLSVLWIVCSLPLVTMGAASCALYYSVVRGIRQNAASSLTKLFFSSFRTNIRQGIAFSLLIGLPCAVFAAVAYVTVMVDLGTFGLVYRFLSIWLIAFALLIAQNAFPVIGRFTLPGRDVFAASIGLIRAGIGRQLLLFASFSLLALVCFLYPPCLLLAPGLYAYACSLTLENLFPRVLSYTDPLDRPPEDPWEAQDTPRPAPPPEIRNRKDGPEV